MFFVLPSRYFFRGLLNVTRYKPRLLATMNRLPSSVLTLQPNLVHTRPFLVLPSTAKASNSPKPLLSPEQERVRLLVRRFQVAAKCVDEVIARAYIDRVFDQRQLEASFVRQNALARGEDVSVFEVRQGGELEEALEAWRMDLRDEEERKVKGKVVKGKWTGIRFASAGDPAGM
jgi:hypothetical protein